MSIRCCRAFRSPLNCYYYDCYLGELLNPLPSIWSGLCSTISYSCDMALSKKRFCCVAYINGDESMLLTLTISSLGLITRILCVFATYWSKWRGLTFLVTPRLWWILVCAPCVYGLEFRLGPVGIPLVKGIMVLLAGITPRIILALISSCGQSEPWFSLKQRQRSISSCI